MGEEEVVDSNRGVETVVDGQGEEEDGGEEPALKRVKLENEEEGGGEKVKRRRVALFLGYKGEKYQGMQRNPGVKTVEAALYEALIGAGCIPEVFRADFSKLKWARSARTDKGVSAAGQVVSANLRCEVDGELQDSIVEKINQGLPVDITLYGWMRSTGSFSAKNDCVKRRYEYIMPENALGRRDVASEEGFTETTNEAGDPRVRRFNTILAKYHGSHRFHNFTDNMDGKDPSAQRYILECKCSEPFEIDGAKFVKVVLLGQSFVLHQIRKMIGLAIQIVWAKIPLEIIDVCLSPDRKVATPTAPALGLLLAECYFEFYNRRYKRELRQPIALDPFREKAETFKVKQIYPFIAQKEKELESMEKWIRRLPEAFPIDSGKILGDYEMLAAEKRVGEERRRQRMESLYPVYEEIEDLFQESLGEELERKKDMLMSVKRMFDKGFGYSPSSFARVPGAVTLVGEWQEVNELPALTFALSDDIIVAVAKKTTAETVVVMHQSEELADVVLRPNGSRVASTEEPSRTDWGRLVSWGWQCGVSGKGARPKTLPAARLAIGGDLDHHVVQLESESALLVASLLAFMDMYSWKMPRMDMAMMGYGWDRQGRGRALGLAKYMTILGGKSNSVCHLTFAPKPEIAFRSMPTGLSFVLVTPTRKVEIDNETEQKKIASMKAEYLLTAKLLAKRLDQPNPLTVKSLGALLRTMDISVAKMLELITTNDISDESTVTVVEAALELGVADAEELRKRYLDNVALDQCRMGFLSRFALSEAHTAIRLWELLKVDAHSQEQLDEVGFLLQRSQDRKSQIESESDEVKSTVETCVKCGALSARSSGILDSRASWCVLCTLPSEKVGEFLAKISSAKEGQDVEIAAKQVHPSSGASIWASMKKADPRDKKRAKMN